MIVLMYVIHFFIIVSRFILHTLEQTEKLVRRRSAFSAFYSNWRHNVRNGKTQCCALSSQSGKMKIIPAEACNKKKQNQLHAVSRTQQGRQRKPSAKTLRSPLSAEFWRHSAEFWRRTCRCATTGVKKISLIYYISLLYIIESRIFYLRVK